MIALQDIKYVHKNERDIEVPSLLVSVQNKLDNINTLLDVGCHWSWAYYAPQLKSLLCNKLYDGIDVYDKDEQTKTILDHYITGNVCDVELLQYDYVSCISSIEHCGLTTYNVSDFRSEQVRVFRRLAELARRYLFLSFPFGLDHLYEGQYANITNTLLQQFNSIAEENGLFIEECEFYFNEFSPGGEPWQKITRREATQKPMIRERGAQCICLVEWAK